MTSRFMTDPHAMRDMAGRFEVHAQTVEDEARRMWASAQNISGAGWSGMAEATSLDTMTQMNQAFRNIVNMLHGVRDGLVRDANNYEQQEQASQQILAGTASPAVTDQQPAGPASPARAAGTTHAARGSGIPVAAEATAATLGKAPSELVGEPTFPAVATEAAGSAGASDAAIATGAAGPAVTDQSRTVAGPTVLTGGTRPTVPAIAIQQSTRPTGLARPAVSAVADQRPANNAWVGALTALSTSCANVALAVSAAAYHPPPEVRAATNCARYAAACALICWYSCAFAPNSAAIAIDTSSAAVGRQRRRRACHERIGRADRRTDPRHICGGRGQKEGCAITNDM